MERLGEHQMERGKISAQGKIKKEIGQAQVPHQKKRLEMLRRE